MSMKAKMAMVRAGKKFAKKSTAKKGKSKGGKKKVSFTTKSGKKVSF